MEVRKLQVKELHKLGNVKRYSDLDEIISWNTLFIKRGALDIYGIFDEKGVLYGKINVAYTYLPYACEDTRAIKGRRAYLYAFIIHQHHRNQGLGNQMLTEVLKSLEKSGYSEMTIGADVDDTRAHHLYEKYGFTKFLGREHYKDGSDMRCSDLYMRRLGA